MKRTHYLNELNISHVDQEVSLSGFVHRRRDHGGLIFIDLRDRFGITQVTFDPEISAQAHELANTLRSEFVINIKGKVIQRPDGCLLYTSPSPRDATLSRMPSSA